MDVSFLQLKLSEIAVFQRKTIFHWVRDETSRPIDIKNLAMNINWLRNPKNIWGRWVVTPKGKKVGGIVAISLLLLLPPLWQYWEYSTQYTELTQIIQQQKTQFAHQERLLASLQSQQQMTPTLARRLVPINELIQSLANKIHVEHSHWGRQTEPRLDLQLKGHFQPLRETLSELLECPELRLLSWHISQLDTEERNIEQSIQSQILLQLQKETE